MTFRKYQAPNVDAYIAAFPLESRPIMVTLRQLIKSAVPDAEEKISWGVPFYRYYGLLAGFACLKHHVSFGLVTVLDSQVRQTLESNGYHTGKKTIQIQFNQPLPAAAIHHILITQAQNNKNKI